MTCNWGKGLVPWSSKPLPEPMSAQIYNGITKPWWVNLLVIKYLNQYAASLICCYDRYSLLGWLINTETTMKSEFDLQWIMAKSLKLSSKQTVNVDIHTIFIGSAPTCSTVNNAWQVHQSSIVWGPGKIAAILHMLFWVHYCSVETITSQALVVLYRIWQSLLVTYWLLCLGCCFYF